MLTGLLAAVDVVTSVEPAVPIAKSQPLQQGESQPLQQDKFL